MLKILVTNCFAQIQVARNGSIIFGLLCNHLILTSFLEEVRFLDLDNPNKIGQNNLSEQENDIKPSMLQE